jgi:carbonic anhydrase
MPVDRILRGVSRFQRNVYPQHRELFQKLAEGQRPSALFITCADSRIDPCLLTQTKPGELFICRVIGNIVPVYPDAVGGVSATIEYAVGALGVPDVIVCGHTDCGVMKGVLDPESVAAFPAVSAWLKHALVARDGGTDQDLIALTERNVLEQLKNLGSHPSVARRLDEGSLSLHGWVYYIAEGAVASYDPDEGRFVPAHATPGRG